MEAKALQRSGFSMLFELNPDNASFAHLLSNSKFAPTVYDLKEVAARFLKKENQFENS